MQATCCNRLLDQLPLMTGYLSLGLASVEAGQATLPHTEAYLLF